MTVTENFKNTPVKKPINDPLAALSAVRLSFGLLTSSPTNAPQKVPKKIPRGPINISPINKPKVAPMMPDFVPPIFLAPMMGIKYSKIKTPMATENVVAKNGKSGDTKEV